MTSMYDTTRPEQETLARGPTPSVTLERGYSLLTYYLKDDDEPRIILTKHIPETIVMKYIVEAMKSATIAQVEGGKWVAEVGVLPGVWADGENPKQAIDDLDEVIREWLLLKIEDADHDIPRLAGIDLNVL